MRKHRQVVLFVDQSTGSYLPGVSREDSSPSYRTEAGKLCSVKSWMVNNLDFTGIPSLLQVHSFAVLESKQP